MKSAKMFFLLLMTTGLLVVGCEEKTKSEKAKDKIEEAADAVGDLFEQESSDLKEELKEAREDINDRIGGLKAKLADATDETREGIKNGISRLEIQRDKLDASLERMGDNAKEDWASFKSGVRKTLQEVEQDLEEVIN